jgi:hypothetical protein
MTPATLTCLCSAEIFCRKFFKPFCSNFFKRFVVLGAAWFEDAPYEAEIPEEYAYLEEPGLLNEHDDPPLLPTPPLDSQSTELPNSQYAGYFEMNCGRGPYDDVASQ